MAAGWVAVAERDWGTAAAGLAAQAAGSAAAADWEAEVEEAAGTC